MKAEDRFLKKPKAFWACVRTISQSVGYSKKGEIIAPTHYEMVQAFSNLQLATEQLETEGKPSQLAIDLHDYFRGNYPVDVPNP